MTVHEDDQILTSTLTYVSEKGSLLFLVMDRDGLITYSNHHAQTTLEADPTGLNLKDIVVDFASTFDLSILLEHGQEEHLLTLSMETKQPQSFYFTLYQISDQQIAAYGRSDQQELYVFREEILSLNV